MAVGNLALIFQATWAAEPVEPRANCSITTTTDIPGNAYYTSLLNSEYDWAFSTANQPNANNRAIYWPRGKVLGGSSAVNGLYVVRPSQVEVDTWSQLIGAVNGGGLWDWDTMFSKMKSSETFTGPVGNVQTTADVMFDPAARGTTGPWHTSYPG